ncbi:MAG: type I methionyl aminopeptidase [bacterium]
MPILIKDEEAIKNIAVAGNIIYYIFSEISKMNLAGIKTIELNDNIDSVIKSRGASPAFLNYRGFPKSCCISLNDEIVHGIPDNRKIKDGDLVKIDVGVKYHGYIADAARTFPVGDVARDVKKLLKVTQEALGAGIKAAKNGNRISDISRQIQTIVEADGFSVVKELTGHGVGQTLHEEPVIPNFVVKDPDPIISTGMVLAIEPMVNMGSYQVKTASNGWTISTSDGALSCHYEDTIAILEKGNINLTRVVES